MVPGDHHHPDPGLQDPGHGLGHLGAGRVQEEDEAQELQALLPLPLPEGQGQEAEAPGGVGLGLLKKPCLLLLGEGQAGDEASGAPLRKLPTGVVTRMNFQALSKGRSERRGCSRRTPSMSRKRLA